MAGIAGRPCLASRWRPGRRAASWPPAAVIAVVWARSGPAAVWRRRAWRSAPCGAAHAGCCGSPWRSRLVPVVTASGPFVSGARAGGAPLRAVQKKRPTSPASVADGDGQRAYGTRGRPAGLGAPRRCAAQQQGGDGQRAAGQETPTTATCARARHAHEGPHGSPSASTSPALGAARSGRPLSSRPDRRRCGPANPDQGRRPPGSLGWRLAPPAARASPAATSQFGMRRERTSLTAATITMATRLGLAAAATENMAAFPWIGAIDAIGMSESGRTGAQARSSVRGYRKSFRPRRVRWRSNSRWCRRRSSRWCHRSPSTRGHEGQQQGVPPRRLPRVFFTNETLDAIEHGGRVFLLHCHGWWGKSARWRSGTSVSGRTSDRGQTEKAALS